jgi:wobble nucleotide-excising tRNase
LQTFLGRNDLNFEPEGDGYRIMRNGVVAKRLSEGEKTAITFIYFIVQLRDQDFDLGEGIVVIDDPVSSLDSGSVYQAFSFLKNSVKGAKQVFLLTHSFDFLKLLLNWCKNIPKAEGTKSYYMLLCGLDGANQRKAVIEPLDKELLWNENEYAYLFKQLYRFESDGTIAGSYHIPNIARKVLEAFLDFYYPGSESMYRKLEKVNFDGNKKTALLKFANDLSHPTGKGFDPALVPETQKNVQYLLEMIQTVSPIHYLSLKTSIEGA